MSSFSVLKCIYIIYVMDAAFDTVLCVLVSVPQQQQQQQPPGHARIDDNNNNHHDDTCDSVVDVRCFIHQSSPLDI